MRKIFNNKTLVWLALLSDSGSVKWDAVNNGPSFNDDLIIKRTFREHLICATIALHDERGSSQLSPNEKQLICRLCDMKYMYMSSNAQGLKTYTE